MDEDMELKKLAQGHTWQSQDLNPGSLNPKPKFFNYNAQNTEFLTAAFPLESSPGSPRGHFKVCSISSSLASCCLWETMHHC